MDNRDDARRNAEASALAGQREYWDANLDTKNLSNAEEDAAGPDLVEEVLFLSSPEYAWARRQMGPTEGLTALDIGCGMGVNALALAKTGARVVAMDLSRERLRAVREWAEREGVADRLLLVQGEIEHAPLREQAVDRAFTKSVLLHTRIDEAGQEVARILKNDGRGVFIEPSRFNPFVNLYRRFLGPKIWRTIAFYFDDERWGRFERSFARAEREPFFFLGFLAFRWQFARRDAMRFQRSLRWWGRVDTLLFRLCPPLRRLRWMDVTTVWKQ